MSLPARILDACNTDDGATREELLALTGAKYTCLDTEVRRMVLAGRLFQVKRPGHVARYFAFETDATTWLRKQRRVVPLRDQILAIVDAAPTARLTGRGLLPQVRPFGVKAVHAALQALHREGRLQYVPHVGYFGRAPAPRAPRPLVPVGTPATAARARAAIRAAA